MAKTIDEEKEAEQRAKSFNGLTAHEWTLASRSVWNVVCPPRKNNKKIHGATFPEELANKAISIYSKVGDVVLDPFLGTGTTVVSAIRNDRVGIGIELTDKYFEMASEEIANAVNLVVKDNYTLFHGDCEEMLDNVEDSSVQLTFTSPPYADLIHKIIDKRGSGHKHTAFTNSTVNLYSDSELDLGNMPMDVYKEKVTRIMAKLYQKTKPGGYNVWVVKDFRDTKNDIPYVDLHSAIAECGTKAGFAYHDLIIWDQNESRALVALGYPSVFYVNQNHSYLVVMRKKPSKK